MIPQTECVPSPITSPKSRVKLALCEIDLAGIWGLAFVPVELLLKARLRIGSPPEGNQWNFEFSAAKRADSDCRSRAQPFDDP
jgi:hypothetical protein